MPPRRKAAAKAAPPTTPPLDGCIVVVSGTFPGRTHAALQKQVISLGATFEKSVSKDVTHLVVTQADFDKDSAKVTAAKASGIHIISVEWIDESESKSARQSEDDYSFQKPAAPTKKRPIAIAKADDGADADSDDVPQTKKQKPTKGRKATKGSTAVAADTNGTKDDKADVKEEEPVGKKKKETKAEGQIVKSKDTVIPVDERFSLGGYVVYIDGDGVIYDAAMNQTNAQANNNKFYKLQVAANPSTNKYKTWTRWGRVGETGQSAMLGDGSLADAMKNFEKKFKDKSGLRWDDRMKDPKPGKYAYIERSYDSDDEDDEDEPAKADADIKSEDDDYKPPECTLQEPVQDLMRLIFNQQFFTNTFQSLNYDANKLPLGKLAKSTITRGFQALKDLNDILDDPSCALTKLNMAAGPATEQLSNLYYSLIPHAFGRNRPPIICDLQLLKKEVELLESLSDMKDAAEIMKIKDTPQDPVHPLDRQFHGLGLEEMTVLDPKSKEFGHLKEYLYESRGSTHGMKYELDQIFRIERKGEKSRFECSKFSDIPSDRRLLWHGSRCTNFGGILSQGLRIAPPEAPVSGYMFGKGIYLADMSSKSAGYCAFGGSAGNALLLLCEAELGDPMQKLTNASYNAGETAAKGGMVSTWGQGRTGPSKWKDAKCVNPSLEGIKMPDTKVAPGDTKAANATLYYNEYICYDVSQVRLRYLFRVKMSYGY